MHLASETGADEICKSLLNANAFVNSKTKAGWTALHYAAKHGHSNLVDYYVRKIGANVDWLTMKKQTPLHLATTAGKIEASVHFLAGYI